MINDVDKFDAVIVYKLDRLSRSQKDTLYLIEDVFLANNIDFISIQESFDTSTAFGRAMVGILSVFAQLERENIKERTASGRRGRAMEGLFHGGGKRPIGYDYIDGKLVLNDYEAMIVQTVFDMYNVGHGKDTIAKHLRKKGLKSGYGFLSPTTIHIMLQNILYTGKIRWKGEIFDGLHDAIISDSQFQQTQIEIKKRYMEKSYKGQSTLAGMLYCSQCGNKLYRKGYRGYFYYKCNSRLDRGLKGHPEKCSLKTWKAANIDTIIDHEIRKLAFDPDYVDEIIAEQSIWSAKSTTTENKKQIIESKIAELSAQIKKLMKLYIDDKMPIKDITAEIEALGEERDLLIKNLDGIKEEPEEKTKTTEEIKQYMTDMSKLWNDANEDEKRQIITTLIDRITVFDHHIEIDWAFMA
jgi:site-specific DNA recombinase